MGAVRVMRPYQERGFADIFRGWEADDILMFVLTTGGGKCLGLNTPVLMYDGTIKMVQDIVKGDVLMGADSMPRNVLSTCKGAEELYRVTPVKGDPYVVNKSHILSLKISGTGRSVTAGNGRTYSGGDTLNIGVEDYLNSGKSFNHVAKGYRVAIDFVENNTLHMIPPYILGLWLGDGNSNGPGITTPDSEIVSAFTEYAEGEGMTIRCTTDPKRCPTYFATNKIQTGCKGGSNPMRNALNFYGVMNNKHIPHQFKTGSRKDRLELLAGIIDTDGYLHRSGYDLVFKQKELANDIAFVARSVGLATYVKPCKKGIKSLDFTGDYFRLMISGDCDIIPCRMSRKKAPPRLQKKDVLVHGISVESIGEGDYYGFEIDGDHLFLLGDFTVTHNTFTFTEVIRNFVGRGQRCMLIAHREELITQSWQTLYEAKVMAGIIKGDHPTAYQLPVQVCSIQTISRRKNLPHADLIVIDEGHHVTDDNTYGKILKRYPDAKVLIVTATPYRLSGDGFLSLVQDKITRLIVNCTLKELIEDGWLVSLRYHVGSTPDLSGVSLAKGDYDEEQTANVMGMAPIVESYQTHCNGLQGLCFCVNVAHSKEVCRKYNEAGINAVHIDGTTPAEARAQALAAFRRREVLVVCNVGIFTEGTDFPNCEFVQLAAPTKSLSKYFQEVGRGTRAAPGTVDGLHTAQERIDAIAASIKPHCIILDNAGMWKDHPFCDEEIDWEKYFNGWKQEKRKKKEGEPEYIDIPVYEIEDPATGARRKTSNVEEVDGMILVEITHEMRKNIRAKKYIAEFDRLYALFCAMHDKQPNKIKKPGLVSYFKFREYCDGKGIEIEDIAWKHLRIVLCDTIEQKVQAYLDENRAAGRVIAPSANGTIQGIRVKGVAHNYLKSEWQKYKAGERRV